MIGLFVGLVGLYFSQGSNPTFLSTPFTKTHRIENLTIVEACKRELRPRLCFMFENVTLDNINVSSRTTFNMSPFIFPHGTCKRHSRIQFTRNCLVYPYQSAVPGICYTGSILACRGPHSPALSHTMIYFKIQ